MKIGKILSFLLSLAIGLFLFFWVWRTIGFEEIWAALLTLSAAEVLVVLLLGVLNILLAAWRLGEILQSKSHRLSLRELFLLCLVRFSVAYLVPMMVLADELAKIFLLHKRARVALDKSAAAVFIEVVLDFFAMVLVIGTGFLVLFVKTGLIGPGLLVAAVLVILLSLLLFYLGRLKKKSIFKLFFNLSEDHYGRRVEQEIFTFFRWKNRSLLKVLVISFLKFALLGVQYWLLLFFLGKSVSFLSLLLVLGFSLVGITIPISADLGSHEVMVVSAFRVLQIEPSLAVVFTSILRATSFTLALAGLVILFKLGIDFPGLFEKQLNYIRDNYEKQRNRQSVR